MARRASIVRPGHVHHNGWELLGLGERGGPATPRIRRIAEVWADAGFRVEVYDDVERLVWEKLVFNVAFSGTCAVLERTIGEVLDDPSAWQVASACAQEANAVAAARGISLGFDDPVAHVRAFGAKIAGARPSMLLDVHLREFQDSLRSTVEAADYVEWLSLLRCCASFDAYVRLHSASIRPLHVIDFLVLDAQFPRSLRFSADRIEESLKRLSRMSGRTQPARVERLAGLLRASLQFVQIEELLHGDLLQTLEHVRRQCRLIHHATYQSYISYQLESEIA